MSSVILYIVAVLLGLWALALTCGIVWFIKQIGVFPAMLIVAALAVFFAAQEVIRSHRDRKQLDAERRGTR